VITLGDVVRRQLHLPTIAAVRDVAAILAGDATETAPVRRFEP
jgi:hypothetical protein